jgi:hypothetical protein
LAIVFQSPCKVGTCNVSEEVLGWETSEPAILLISLHATSFYL